MKSATYPETETAFLTRRNRSYRTVAGILVAMAILWRATLPAPAATITVPNASFESQVAPPTFPYVTTYIDSWQKAAKPAWFDETAIGISWDQTMGLFQNTPVGDSKHIDNMDGNQGLYMMTFPQAGLFQDYNTTDWNNSTPTHAFSATFQQGFSYRLSVGVLGAGGIPEGASLQLGLYYRDEANNMVNVSTTPIAYTAAAFPTVTHLIDYTVDIPTVQPGDAWAGRNIGISLFSTSGTGAGYWDLDNVRLTEVPEPGSAALLGLGFGAFFWRRLRSRKRV